MPEISRFFGIVISMIYGDHNPPHFHASYQNFTISVEIVSGIVDGKFPKKELKAIFEWLEKNQELLLEDWKLCQEHKQPKPVPPLEKERD